MEKELYPSCGQVREFTSSHVKEEKLEIFAAQQISWEHCFIQHCQYQQRIRNNLQVH